MRRQVKSDSPLEVRHCLARRGRIIEHQLDSGASCPEGVERCREVGEARRVGNAGVLVQEASGAGNDVVHYVERRPSQRMVREQPIGPPACRR